VNWFRKTNRTIQSVPELTTSILYNEATFYNKFTRNRSGVVKGSVILRPKAEESRSFVGFTLSLSNVLRMTDRVSKCEQIQDILLCLTLLQ